MNDRIQLTSEVIDNIDYIFYDVCRDIFELLDNEKMLGVKCSSLEVHNDKIIAQTNRHLTKNFISSDIKMIAKRDDDGFITKGSRITIDDQIEFINNYTNSWRKEIELRIRNFKDAFYNPIFTNSKPLNYRSFNYFCNNLEKYEKILLTDEEKDIIDSHVLDICHEMYDISDNFNKNYISVKNNNEKDRRCLLNDNKIYLSKFIRVDRVYFEDWFETHESGYSFFEVSKRKRKGKVILSDEINYTDKIKFIYNYENWGLKEDFLFMAYDDVNKKNTVSPKYDSVMKKILK